METPAERPFGRMLGIAVLAVLVALVAAVSAFAVGGSTATADNPATSPAQTQPVQDVEPRPSGASDPDRAVARTAPRRTAPANPPGRARAPTTRSSSSRAMTGPAAPPGGRLGRGCRLCGDGGEHLARELAGGLLPVARSLGE